MPKKQPSPFLKWLCQAFALLCYLCWHYETCFPHRIPLKEHAVAFVHFYLDTFKTPVQSNRENTPPDTSLTAFMAHCLYQCYRWKYTVSPPLSVLINSAKLKSHFSNVKWKGCSRSVRSVSSVLISNDNFFCLKTPLRPWEYAVERCHLI